MTPELLQERENRLRRAFLENDFGEASDRLNNAAEIGIIENKEQFLKASAVAGWAGSQMNRPVNPTSPDWQGIKDGIARGYFKKKDAKNVTDDELFAQIAADYKAQDAAFEAAKDAAARGESWLGKFREKEAELPEMAGGRQTSYLGMTRQVHDAFRAKIAPYQATIASVAQKARSIQGPEGADYGSMADELIKIPKEDRPFVLEAISRQIAAKDEAGAAQNLMINFDRGIERYLDTAVSGLERFGESQVGRFIRAAQGFDIQAQTPEEVEKRAQYLDLRDDMRGIATGKLSKLNDVRLLGMNLSGAARNAAMTLGAFVPYVGPAAMVSSFARETANEIRQQNPTMSRADAEQIAMVSAPFQAATEVISDRLLFGKLPNLKRVFTMPVFSAGGIAAQLATRVGVSTGTELAEELAQGTIPRVIQALKDDVPAVDWDGYFEDFKDQAPEMIAEILPMALLGAGVGQLSDYRAGHELIKNRDLLVAAKLTPEKADAIAGAAESGDFTKAESLLRTAWPKAAAQGQAPSEVRDNAVQSFLARSQAVRQEQERATAEAEAIGVAVIRDAEGWKVRLSDGSVIPADSAEAATRMQKDMAMAASEYEAETMVAAVDEMLAQQPGRRFEVTAEAAQAGDNGLVFTNPITGQVREIKDEASLQNLRDEQMALAKKEGEEPAAALILGMNRFEFGNGIISVFQRGLNKDGTADVPRIITAMHEQIEASWRKGVVTGQFSEAESRAAVATIMSQLDVARLGKSATDQEKAWFERAASVARGEGDENLLREVISELAVRTWIGRDKVGEKTGLRPGTILRALDAAVLKAKQPAEMSMMKRLRAWIKAVGAYLRGVVATAKLISQAEQAGTVTDYTEFMDKLLGLTESRREDMAQAEQIKQQMEEDGMAFSLSPTTAQDAEYMAAVAAGDMAKAQRMVDEAAKAEGYSIKAYHGTANRYWDAFDNERRSLSWSGDFGFFFTKNRKIAKGYALEEHEETPESERTTGPEILSVYLKNAKRLKNGPDGVEYVVSDATQIKSAAPVTRDESGNVIPLSQRFNTESADIRFSLSPTSSAEQLANIIESIMQARPELAFKIRQRSLSDINRLIQNWSAERMTWKGDKIRPVVEKRTKASLDREESFRWRNRFRELFDEGMATLTSETLMAWSEGVGKLEQHPLIRQMLGAHGRLMSKSTAESLGKLKTDSKGKAGDYDGAGWLPPAWYAGSGAGIMPDVMAQNLYDDGLLNEPTPDALWNALNSVVTSQRAARAEFAKAESAVKEIHEKAWVKAKAEAQQWRDETEDMMQDDWSPRESLQRDARLFNTAMAAFPAEIRGKIVPGGMVKLTGQATERARYKVIEKAMQKAVVELEKFMRKEQLAEVVKLLDKAGPVGAPGEVKKSRFIVTVQDELDAISEVVGMDVDEVQTQLAETEAALIAAQTPEDADTALTRLNLLETFGGILDIKNTTSVELDMARQYLEGLMAQGRAARRVLDEARRESVKAMVDAASKDAFKGITGPETTQEAKKKSAKASGKAMLKKFFNELSGFDGVLRDAFGPNSETATKFSERFTLNSNNFEDTQNERRKRLRDFARDLYRTRLGAVINQKLIKLEQIESASGVTYLKGREVKTHKFTVDDALKIVADPKAFGFTDAQAQEISDEIQSVQMAGGRRTSFTYEQEISKGDRVEIPLSQMDAVYMSMALRQPGILEQQQRYGYDQETVDQLENFLTDDAKRWREWMQGEYDAEYSRANAVYMRMFNTRMPRIQFYAPLLKNHQGTQATLDPLNTGLVAQSANPGSIKARKARTSSLRIESALNVFWSHFNQMDYWVTHAEYLRDVQAVMLNPKVRESVVSAHGEEGMQTISAWVSLQMARGVSKGALAVAGSRMFRNVKSAVSMKALALNLGTSLKTIPSVLYSLGEIHLSKWPAALVNGMKHWSRLWDTNIIQRRLDIGGMPELRDLGSSALPMSWVNQAIRYGSYPTMYADGVLTTFSAAMAYGVNYDAAIEQGATENAAHEYAKERTALIVSKTAQPENWTQKSLFENDASGAGSLFFMFTSDPRQKLALAGEALNNWRKGTATTEEAMRKFLAYWVIPGVMFQLANAIGRSLFKGDDDEWDVVDFATAGIVGQLQGLVLLGSAAEMIVAAAVAGAAEKITGEEVKRKPFWNSPKNPLDQAAQEIVKASESLDFEDGKDGLGKAWQLTKAGGMLMSPFTPAGAIPSTAERVMKDTTNLFYREE